MTRILTLYDLFTVNNVDMNQTIIDDSLILACSGHDFVHTMRNYKYINMSRAAISATKYTELAKAIPTVNGGEVVWLDETLRHRAVVDGKVDNRNLEGSYVRIKLEQVTHQDSGLYVCDLEYIDTSGRGAFETMTMRITVSITTVL